MLSKLSSLKSTTSRRVIYNQTVLLVLISLEFWTRNWKHISVWIRQSKHFGMVWKPDTSTQNKESISPHTTEEAVQSLDFTK